MDPFVVISFGKKVFRTRVIRHSRNPVWDEKLLFHVRRYETNFNVHLSILDWDKLSANDHIGDASFGVGELIEGNKGCQPDERGLYSGTGEGEMREFKLKLETGKGEAWEVKHTPTISLRYVFAFQRQTGESDKKSPKQSEVSAIRCPSSAILEAISRPVRH